MLSRLMAYKWLVIGAGVVLLWLWFNRASKALPRRNAPAYDIKGTSPTAWELPDYLSGGYQGDLGKSWLEVIRT